jgi:hypothetical protein
LSERKRQDPEELRELDDKLLDVVGYTLEGFFNFIVKYGNARFDEGFQKGREQGQPEGKRLEKGKDAETKPRGRPKDPKSNIEELLVYFVQSEREKNGTTIKEEVTRFLEFMRLGRQEIMKCGVREQSPSELPSLDEAISLYYRRAKKSGLNEAIRLYLGRQQKRRGTI